MIKIFKDFMINSSFSRYTLMAPLSTQVLNTLLNSSLSLNELQCYKSVEQLPLLAKKSKICAAKILWHSLLRITHYTVHVQHALQLKHNTQSLRQRTQIRNVWDNIVVGFFIA